MAAHRRPLQQRRSRRARSGKTEARRSSRASRLPPHSRLSGSAIRPEPVVHELSANHGGGHTVTGNNFKDLHFGVVAVRGGLYDGEVGPLAAFYAPRFAVDPEGSRAAEGRKLEARLGVEAVQPHGG